MKKIFTLMAAAAVGVSAFAGHRSDIVLPSQLSAEGQHRMMAHQAMLENDLKAGIERPGVIKRSFTQGNVLYNLMIVMGGPLVNYFDVDYTMEQWPMYGAECYLMGRNMTNGQTANQVTVLLDWPSRYCEQLITWDGPWEEYEEDGEKVYDIPAAMRDLSVIPFSEFVSNDKLNAQFQLTGGYILPFGEYSQDPNKHNIEKYTCYTMFDMGGCVYNGAVIELINNWSPSTPGGSTPTVKMNSYNESNENVNVTFNMLGKTQAGANANFVVDYKGAGLVEGFVKKNIEKELAEVFIYNAGQMDYDEMGDTYPFYTPMDDNEEWDETLQLYYLMAVAGDGVIGQNQTMMEELKKDPTFNPANVSFWLASEDSNPETIEFMDGYLFSAVGASCENSTWWLKRAEEYTWEEGRDEFTLYDYLLPTANMFVNPREYFSDNELSAWSVDYGVITVLQNNWVNYAVNKGAYIATNTPEGFVYKYEDNFGNTRKYTGKNVTIFANYEDMLDGKEVVATGTNNPDSSVKTVAAAPANMKVVAANGRINVTALEDADVQVYSLNGGLLRSASVKAGNTLSVEAGKGLYIVKAGNQASKVIL